MRIPPAKRSSNKPEIRGFSSCRLWQVGIVARVVQGVQNVVNGTCSCLISASNRDLAGHLLGDGSGEGDASDEGGSPNSEVADRADDLLEDSGNAVGESTGFTSFDSTMTGCFRRV